MRHLGLFAVVGASLLGTSAIAVAEPDVFITADARTHQLEATIKDGPNVRASDITIADLYAKPAMAPVRASVVRAYADGDEPVAVAFVISGEEIWTGNDTFETDDAALYFGALKGVESGIDMMALPQVVPHGSEATIVTYATGAQIAMPLGPIARLTGAALGSQLQYKNKIGDDLVSGITVGLHELERSSLPRKALIVIGDGNDTNNEAAKAQLAELKRQARTVGIDLFAIVYKSPVSDPETVITAMIPAARTVNSFDGRAAELASISSRITNRYYVTFPGDDMLWDGAEHDLVVRLAGTEVDAVTLTLPGSPARPAWWRIFMTGWFLQLGAGILLAGGIVLLRKLTDRRCRLPGT